MPGRANIQRRLAYLDDQFPPEVVGLTVLIVFAPQEFQGGWNREAAEAAQKTRRDLEGRTRYDKYLVWIARQVAATRGEDDGLFDPDRLYYMTEYVSSVIDWARQAQGVDLNQLSWDEAEAGSDAWHAELAARMKKAGKGSPGTVVLDLGDGWTLQDLTTSRQLRDEGAVMGHCVGDYFSDVQGGSLKIYSVRDPAGKSHVTIEANADTASRRRRHRAGDIAQVQGKANTPVKSAYRARTAEALLWIQPDPTRWSQGHYTLPAAVALDLMLAGKLPARPEIPWNTPKTAEERAFSAIVGEPIDVPARLLFAAQPDQAVRRANRGRRLTRRGVLRGARRIVQVRGNQRTITLKFPYRPSNVIRAVVNLEASRQFKKQAAAMNLYTFLSRQGPGFRSHLLSRIRKRLANSSLWKAELARLKPQGIRPITFHRTDSPMKDAQAIARGITSMTDEARRRGNKWMRGYSARGLTKAGDADRLRQEIVEAVQAELALLEPFAREQAEAMLQLEQSRDALAQAYPQGRPRKLKGSLGAETWWGANDWPTRYRSAFEESRRLVEG